MPWQPRLPPVAVATRGAGPAVPGVRVPACPCVPMCVPRCPVVPPPPPGPAVPPGAARGAAARGARRGGLCRGALPARPSAACGAGGGRWAAGPRPERRAGGSPGRPVLSGRDSRPGPGARAVSRAGEAVRTRVAGTGALIVCETLFVRRDIIRIVWELGVNACFHLEMNACGQQSGPVVRGAGGSTGGAGHACVRRGSAGGMFIGTQGCCFWVAGDGFLKLEMTTLAFLYACKELHGQCSNSNQI